MVLLDLTSDAAVEIPWGEQAPARIYRNPPDRGSLEQRAPRAGRRLTCLGCASSLHIQSVADFASLACDANRVTDGMVDFSKEIAGCSTGGAADCVFLAADIGLLYRLLLAVRIG